MSSKAQEPRGCAQPEFAGVALKPVLKNTPGFLHPECKESSYFNSQAQLWSCERSSATETSTVQERRESLAITTLPKDVLPEFGILFWTNIAPSFFAGRHHGPLPPMWPPLKN
ncbi:Hypothetical predicted protein [Marmota monax]|uniref:Uncharacterized protein n=1 Tax=Marmota monax TaxID=9995 RepID=A0A5E4BF30_MARMO|nr:Hypothetical predicted protein [Marmota monax]